MACFLDDFEACIAHFRMPVNHRRRLKIIPNAFGENPVLKFMFSAMIRAAYRWWAIRITPFERRQMAAVRQELDQEYEAGASLAKHTSKFVDIVVNWNAS